MPTQVPELLGAARAALEGLVATTDAFEADENAAPDALVERLTAVSDLIIRAAGCPGAPTAHEMVQLRALAVRFLDWSRRTGVAIHPSLIAVAESKP